MRVCPLCRRPEVARDFGNRFAIQTVTNQELPLHVAERIEPAAHDFTDFRLGSCGALVDPCVRIEYLSAASAIVNDDPSSDLDEPCPCIVAEILGMAYRNDEHLLMEIFERLTTETKPLQLRANRRGVRGVQRLDAPPMRR